MRFRLLVAPSSGNIVKVAPTRCLSPPPATGQSQRVQQLETHELFNAGPKLGPFSGPRIGDQESDVRLSAFSFAIPESSPESGPEIGDIVRTWAPDKGILIAITGRSSARARQDHFHASCLRCQSYSGARIRLWIEPSAIQTPTIRISLSGSVFRLSMEVLRFHHRGS